MPPVTPPKIASPPPISPPPPPPPPPTSMKLGARGAERKENASVQLHPAILPNAPKHAASELAPRIKYTFAEKEGGGGHLTYMYLAGQV